MKNLNLIVERNCANTPPSCFKRASRIVWVLILMLTIGVGQMWGADVTDNITATDLAATSTTYTDFSDVSKTSDAKYAGNSAKDNSGNIQLRSKNSNSGIVSTTSGGTVKSVKITVGSGTNNVDVYGSNTAYTAASDLYNNSKQGTKVGSVTATGTITFSDDYAYVGIRSNNGAIYLSSVEITWTAGAASPSITTSVSSLSEVGYSTTDFTQQVKSFTVSGSSLTADVTVTAPTGYEVCKTENGTYTSSVTFDKGSGTLSAQTVYVRLASGKVAGSYSGNVTCTSTGATTKNVAVSGSVPFTVTWKANGTTHATTYVAYATGAGTALGSLPTEPDPEDYSCTGNAFFGWYDGEAYSHASAAPSVISTSTKITSNKTYNAVFATASSGGTQEVNDALNRATTGVTGTDYSSWSNKKASSDAIYAGNSAGGNSSIQLRSNNSNSGIVTTSSGGKAKKVTVVWNSNTASGRTLDIYGKNSAYSAASDLYGDNKGTKLGSIVNGTSTELTITGDYEYIGMHSNSGAMYLTSVTIKWEAAGGTTYSNYATSCCEPLAQINGSIKLTQNSASAREFSWENETTASDVDHYELSYKQKNAQGDPTLIANNITNSTHAYTHTANLIEGNTYTYYLKAVGASGHCDVTEELDVLIPYATSTVTFNDNGKTNDGTVPDAITQNTGTTVTVPGNTGNLAKDNYAFGGWNTKDDGTGTNYIADATFTLSNDITLYAKWDCAKKVTLTKGTPSNGSFSLSEANGDKYTCDGSVVVTVSDITPTSGYRLVGITQTGLESGVSIDQANKTVTYAQYANGSSTINVEFEEIPVYTITWSVNGLTSTTNVTDGNALVLPDIEPTSCDPTNYGTFVGWYTVAAGSDSEPSANLSGCGTKAVASHIPTGDETYYAVWANGALSADEVKQVTLDFTDNSEWEFPTDYVNSTKENSYTNSYTVKLAGSGATSTGYKWNSSTSALIIGKEDAYLKLPAFSFATSKIVVTGPVSGASGKVTWNTFVGDDAVSTEVTGSNANHTFNIASANQAAGNVYAFKVTNDNNLQIKTIEVYSPGAGATAFISTCCTKHTITLDDEIANGSVASTESSVCEGTSVTLTATATPNAGRFKTWDVTGMTLTNEQKATNPLTISMPDNDITVSATFDALYAISKVEEGGTITLGANYAAENDVVTISAVAKQDYEEPRELKVYKTGDESTEITITAGAFTMPGYPVTAKVTYTASKTPLDPPTMGDNSNLTYNSVQLNWTNVANNSGYVLTVKQGEDVVEGYDAKAIDKDATSAVISGLEHLTDYTYTLYAKGDGVTYVAVNTAAEGGFTTLDYPTVKIYYSENEVLRVAAGEDQKILTDFTLPSTALNSCTQKELVGWTTAANAEYSHDTDAPEGMLLPGAKWQIPTNANCTLYAVYAKVTPEVVSWDATAITDLTSSDAFVIVGNNGSNYAMTNDNGTSNPPAATSITITDEKLSNAPADNLKWNISGNATDGYTFYPNGSTATWLYCTNANNGVRVGTGDAKHFTISSGYLYETETKDSRYVGIYNSQDWRCYTSMSTNINDQTFTFYKKNVTPAETTNYATQCMAQVAKPSITDVTDGVTYEENKTVTITCGTSDATIYYSIDGQNPATEYTEPFTLSDNGEYTIRAYATKSGMIESDEADEVTITIDKPFTTIASFIAAEPTNKKLAFTAESNAVVMGRTNSRIYIQDPTGGIYLYVQAGHGKNWAKEKKVVGTLTGTYELNENTPRMVVTDFGETVATADGSIPDAVVIEGAIDAENFAANRNKLVTVSGLNFQSESVADGGTITITRGSDTYNIYNAFNALTSHVLPLSTTACSVTGILGYYNNKYQLMPIDANCIVTNANAVLPTLSVSGSTDSENPTAVAEGKEITVTPATGMTSTLKDGTADATDLTSATVVTIDVDKAIKVTAAREYYANAEATYYYHADPSLTERAISKAAMTNGSVTVKNGDDIVEVAVNGATITLLVAPSTNYHMTSISVTDADAGNVDLTEVTAGEVYTFTMPAKAVTVSATFAEDDYATINFVKGETAATGSAPASIAKAYVGKQVTMPVNTFALAAHDFAGWKHGDNTYAEGAKYTVTAADHEASPIFFEAQWTPWPIWATTYTSNIIKSGVNTPDASVIPEDHEAYDAWKIAKGSSISLTIPAGTTTIYGHVAAWNKESADVTISGACFSSSRVLSPAADGGIHDGSPFTLDEAGSTYYFKLTPDVAIEEDVNITFTTEGNKRAVVFGVNAVYPEITLDPSSVAFGNVRANQTKSQEFTITANENVSGTLSATLLNNASGKFSVGAIEDNKVTVTFDPDGATSGDFSAQLKISASNAQVTADLTGTAISAEAPEIIVNKNAVVFGQVDPNASVSEAISVQLLHIEGAVSAALSGDDVAKFVLSTTSLTADGDIVVTPNTTENGIFSATLTLSATDADDVVIPLSITVANKWAVTYTSNVTLTTTGGTSASNAKVKVNGEATEYSAIKAGSGGSKGEVVITVPAKTKKLHVHAAAWNESGSTDITLSITGAATIPSALSLVRDAGISGTSTTYTLANSPISQYYEISIPDSETPTALTFGTNAGNKRFVIYGVNEEGGIHELPDGTTNASTLPEEINLLVSDGTTLNVNSNKTLNDVTIQSTSGAFNEAGTSGQLTGDATLTVTGNLYLEIKLCEGAMDAEASRKWYCISAPFNVAINGGFFWGDGTPMVLNTHFQLFEWDGDRRATGASGWRRTSSNMKAHTAYFIGFDDARSNQNTIKLKAMSNTISNTNTIEAPSHGNDGDYANWNGLGNPNFHHIALDQNVQAFDYDKQGYSPYATGAYNFVVGTPFFIQYAGDIAVQDLNDGKPFRAPKRESETYSYCVRIGSAEASADNQIYVRASETASAEFDNERDMITLNGTSSNYGALLWTENYGGKRLAIEEAPLVNGTASYVLTLSAPKAGTYSIRVAVPQDNADLYLTYEGSIIWNLSMSEYTLDLNKGITNGYGLILRANAPSAATGIDEAESGKQKAESVQKIILDEKVFILRGGKMYDVTGKAVK